MTAEVEATRTLLDAAREKGLPVVYTTIGFAPHGKDGGIWTQKVPALLDLDLEGKWVDIDPRLGRQDDEVVIMKKGASGFFGTNLASVLVAQGRRHGGSLRSDNERLRSRHGCRSPSVRLAGRRAARVCR